MTKLELLSALRGRLTSLSAEDLERTLEYYSESIDDRMEDGLTEEEAVEAMGSIDEIVAQVLMGAPRPKPGKAKPKRTGNAWVIALLILGFPLWFPLMIAFGSVAFSLYVVFWSLIVVLFAVGVTLAAGAVSGILGCAAGFLTYGATGGLFTLGVGLVCAGFAILWFFGCILAAKGLIWISKTLFLAIGSCFGRRKRKEHAS